MSDPLPERFPGERIGLRARLADPRLVSWPTFVISSVLLTYEIWLHGFFVFALTQFLVFAWLAAARWMYLRRRYATHHAWVMVVTIVSASLFGAVIVQLLLAESTAVVTVDGAFARMIVIPAAGLLSVSLIDYRNNVRELRSTTIALEATRDTGLASLASARQNIVDQVRASLEGRVDEFWEANPRAAADELASLAQETVRPLSHELAATTPDFTPLLPQAQRLRWSAVLSEVAGRPLIVPWLMASAVTLMSIRFTLAEPDAGQSTAAGDVGPVTVSVNLESLASSFAFLFAVFLSVWLFSVLAVRISRPVLTRVSGGMRWVVIAASVVGIGLGLQLILIAVPVLPGPLASIDTDPIGRFWAFAPVVVIALVLAIARTISFARASVLDELRAINNELTWEVARIRLNLWAQQRQFAQAIHGPLQAAITSSALLLSQSGEFDRAGAIEAARNRITSALDRVTGHEEPAADWTTGFAEIERTWAGVCEVAASVDADAARMLDRDDTCRQAAVMVMGESVANAAIHGKATRVDVYVDMVHERFIRITLNDNGQGIDAAANTGLGSAILDDTCGEWELNNTGHGARLTAVLAAVSPVLA